MLDDLRARLGSAITLWLTRERPAPDLPRTDFERLSYELRPGDVILVEGRTRLSEIIKNITQSTWTHSALYIGRLHDIDSPALRERVLNHYRGDPGAQLVVEALMGLGIVIHHLPHYQDHNLRICRPTRISRHDAQGVIAHAIQRIGQDYDVRQLLDLARFMFPYGLLPRRWRSTLFQHHAGVNTRCTCSTMIVEAFESVGYPILPAIERASGKRIKLHKRNPRLYTPKDFDDSPYFDIIKCPFLGDDAGASYRELPWSGETRLDEPRVGK
ncbi:MAG: YiiX/YebB-like N1pC/P60 family cysteine hydrolase [Gammaproteobacteria bacterium]